jgi:hypothetical protein
LWGVWARVSRPPDPRVATARTQTELGEHEAAFRTYQEVLKDRPDSVEIPELQADAAMAWLRNFRVTVGEGQKAEDIAGPPLAEIIRTLEAALARSGGRRPRAGDILAHLGWAHWLNQRIAAKEFGSAAERALRQSLTVDPTNVFGQAMLGGWLLQTHGDSTDAIRHLDAAEKTNQHRQFVRDMQLGGMIYNDEPGVPAALMRVANQMRIQGETMAPRQRSRILGYFRPSNEAQVKEMLSAVPPDDAWATFQWLDNSDDARRREFVHARVQELR